MISWVTCLLSIPYYGDRFSDHFYARVNNIVMKKVRVFVRNAIYYKLWFGLELEVHDFHGFVEFQQILWSSVFQRWELYTIGIIYIFGLYKWDCRMKERYIIWVIAIWLSIYLVSPVGFTCTSEGSESNTLKESDTSQSVHFLIFLYPILFKSE